MALFNSVWIFYWVWAIWFTVLGDGSHMSPGLASLVIQVQAVFTILLALVLFKETIRLPQVLALIISFAGIVLIAMQGNSDATPIGLAVILIAALSWSAGNLVAKKSGKVNIIAFLARSSIFAIPPLALMSYYYEGPSLIIQSLGSAHWQAWAIVLW